MSSVQPLDVFFAQARLIAAGELTRFTLSPNDLLEIATYPAIRGEFNRKLKELNDPDLQEIIIDFFEDASDSLRELAASNERKVDLVDRAGLAVSASVTVAGIGTTVAAVAGTVLTISLAGPVALFGGGIAGLVICAFGRDWLKRRANRDTFLAAKLQRLIKDKGR